MKNKKYNYIFGSLVGLIESEKREEITKNILIQIEGLTSIRDIERICKGILCQVAAKEDQAVRVAKDLSQFLVSE
jgi:hypothetical protein